MFNLPIRLLLLVVGIALILLGQATPINAQAGRIAAYNGAVPVYCSEISALDPAEKASNVTCRRADDRSIITPVPADHYLLITDLIINRNGGTTPPSGSYFLTVGRDAGGSFVSSPQFNFSGEYPERPLQFNAPYLTLLTGENLGVYNSNLSTRTVDLFISGYLVPDGSFTPTSINGLNAGIVGSSTIAQIGTLLLLVGVSTWLLTPRKQRHQPARSAINDTNSTE